MYYHMYIQYIMSLYSYYCSIFDLPKKVQVLFLFYSIILLKIYIEQFLSTINDWI